jgi:hypothetical protein
VEILKEGRIPTFPLLQTSHTAQTQNGDREKTKFISPEETLGWLVHLKEA